MPRSRPVVQRADVRVVQRRNGLRFALEALAPRWIRRELWRQDLDGDRPVEPGVARPIHLAHPALAEQPLDDVGTQPVARRQRAGGHDLSQHGRVRHHRQQFTAQFGIVAALHDEVLAIAGRQITCRDEQRLGAFPFRRVHRSPFIRRPSQNLAAATSRLTVAGEIFLIPATSSSVNPPKYRSSTISA